MRAMKKMTEKENLQFIKQSYNHQNTLQDIIGKITTAKEVIPERTLIG